MVNKRVFKQINQPVSEIGLGTWQLGTKWGDPFNEKEAEKILQTAYENNINLIDTADIYNDGESEKAIGQFMKNNATDFFVVTKCGRGLNPHTAEMYTPEAIEKFAEASLKRLQIEKLDMLLLHCPPSSVYKKDAIFTKLDKMQQAGKILSYGVSVEKVSEALDATIYPIAAVEIIFNMFRLKPAEDLFSKLKAENIGAIARVPLASGLLTGKYTPQTTFGKDDHRSFNRNGEAFDKGETFSGVDYDLGLQAVAELKALFETDNLIPYALKWILMHDAITTVIPGASNNQQVIANVAAASIPDLTTAQMTGVKKIYDQYIRKQVHPNW
ncbi:aryl-alcohol dehydrogenase-like predicted oxidoreductase [Enterococcus sp. PF1-24]|uniref:aldo/keto reductase n=1 Tax=unclassified Enterococcus TaxID=2608891 RepID=UPI002476C588|nr:MULTISPECIES: aldo/keto reductase [unclassified Enterococcus]MDH6364799.1 aryl-alcohol dehydrogenase-like predicted oxidoreductase [Enterococcus sp. PFB1-1]MDH6401856.1 aryl-alcohol dehydrogenase-like predicted oxidoreductase [Enterococcus sp. PF1-24]